MKKQHSKITKRGIEKEIAAQLKKSLADDLKKALQPAHIKEMAVEEGLEEELEEAENIRDMEFHEAMRPTTEVKAPVLERIAEDAPRPVFVGTIPQGTQTDEKEDEIRYVTSSGEKNEPKYAESSAATYVEPERLTPIERRRDTSFSQQVNQGAMFIKHPELERDNVEPAAWQVGRSDFDARREREEDRKYKFKVPK